jgi:hypothetical protein
MATRQGWRAWQAKTTLHYITICQFVLRGNLKDNRMTNGTLMGSS